MSDDTRLVMLIAFIWLLIAAAYTSFFLPIIAMPMGVRVWGAGALVFLVLAIVIFMAERKAR